MRLKGIHLAMKSGMLAADAIFAALEAKGDYSAAALAALRERIFAHSWAFTELHAARNFHAGFKSGLVRRHAQRGDRDGHAVAVVSAFVDRLSGHAGHERMRENNRTRAQASRPAG